MTKELQEAKQAAAMSQTEETILQRNLQSEQRKLELTNQELAEAKKQLEDLRVISSRPTPSTTQHQQQQQTISQSLPQLAASSAMAPPSVASVASSSVASSAVGSDFALNIIRQSSVQQDALQQKILDLQTQLDALQNNLLAKTRELQVYQEEASVRTREMSDIKTSMLTDIHHVKEDRDGLRAHLNLLQTDKARLQSENARLDEENRKQKKEMQDLMTRYMSELQVRSFF
jgi:hypothetical protein